MICPATVILRLFRRSLTVLLLPFFRYCSSFGVILLISCCLPTVILLLSGCSSIATFSFLSGRVKMTFTIKPLSIIRGFSRPDFSHSLFIMDKPRPQCSIRPPMNITFAISGLGGREVLSLPDASSNKRSGDKGAGNRPAFSISTRLSYMAMPIVLASCCHAL